MITKQVYCTNAHLLLVRADSRSCVHIRHAVTALLVRVFWLLMVGGCWPSWEAEEQPAAMLLFQQKRINPVLSAAVKTSAAIAETKGLPACKAWIQCHPLLLQIQTGCWTPPWSQCLAFVLLCPFCCRTWVDSI